jgi:hypothetical protein
MLSFFLCFSLSVPAFQWPARYTIIGTWNIPYTNVSNPITVVHEPDRQYTNQLNGIEQIWSTTAQAHFHRKVVPNGTAYICYNYNKTQVDWDIELTYFLPDPDGYVTQPGLYSYRGRLAKLHTKTESGGKTQTWKLYTDPDSGYPISYIAQAISLFGSHYDVYILDIDTFIPDVLPGVWSLPSTCDRPIGSDPYPGNRFNLFFPGNAGHNRSGLKFGHLTPSQFLRNIKRRTDHPGLKKFVGDSPVYPNQCAIWTSESGPTLPVNFSWRTDFNNIVGDVRDQVACGSCWAFGTSEILQSQFAMQSGVNRPISVNQIMDCTWDNNNYACAGGEVDWAFTSMILNNLSIAYEEDYPYLGVGGMCMNDSTQYKPAGTVARCWRIGKRIEDVKQALYRFGPLAVAIGVTESMLLYNGGVFDDKTCTGALDDLDHSVVLTGWKVIDGKEAWEIKNSWSTWWGDQGYIYIQSENQEWSCGVTTDAVAVEVLPAY